jgi:hypothetical protein
MTIGKGKRPRDPNQLAKWIVERSTNEVGRAGSGCRSDASLGTFRIHGRYRPQKGGQIGGKRRPFCCQADKRLILKALEEKATQ